MNYRLVGNNDYFFDPKKTIANNRGLSSIREITEVSEQDTFSPFLLNNMRRACETLIDHLNSNKIVLLIVDEDCDGYAGNALFYRYLMKSYDTNKVIVHFHDRKKHGIFVDDIKDYEYDILVIIDAGSNDYEAHKHIKGLGKTIIVLDHHQATKESEFAIVVNPQLDNYPNKNISGSVVALKFCQALDSLSGYRYSNGLEDLAILGMVSDMMNIAEKENRALLNKALNNLATPFIQKLPKLISKIQKIGISEISFYIAPLVNAVTRVGLTQDKKLLFNAMCSDEDFVLKGNGFQRREKTKIEKAVAMMYEAKEKQDDISITLVGKLEKQIEEQRDNPILVLQMEDVQFRSFTGLVANIISSRELKPTIILVNNNNIFSGSGRNFEYSRLENFREYCSSSTFVDFALGHSSAFGIKIDGENNLINFINESNSKKLPLSKEYVVDFDLKCDKISDNFVETLDSLKDFYGYGFQEPKVRISNIVVDSSNIVSNTAQTMVKFPINKNVLAISFKNVSNIYEEITNSNQCIIDLIGTANVNVYANLKTYQIFIDEIDIKCYNKEEDKIQSEFRW